MFADVTFRREGSDLVVTVVENPIINRIAFEGNKRIDTETLTPEVTLRPRVVYTRTNATGDPTPANSLIGVAYQNADGSWTRKSLSSPQRNGPFGSISRSGPAPAIRDEATYSRPVSAIISTSR